MRQVILLLLPCLLVSFWLFTLYRIYTSDYDGRYTKKRWLVSVLNFWGLVAYWAGGDQQRKAR